MNSLRRWIAYDWFKLIILLILLALLIFVPQNPITSGAVAETAGTRVPGATIAPTSAAVAVVPATATQPAVPSATTVAATASPTLAAPTATTVAATATAPAAPTATLAAQPSPTPSPEAGQPTPTPTPAAQPASGSGTVDCAKAAPSHLAVGKQALVSANLYERSAAGLDKPVLRTNLPGQKLDIIGGPVCTPYGSGAYLWWNVKTSAGVTGWSAEASLNGSTYFLQPVP